MLGLNYGIGEVLKNRFEEPSLAQSGLGVENGVENLLNFGKYRKFKQTLPSNLRDTPEREYRMRMLWRSLGKPNSFDEALKSENPPFILQDDGLYHAPSVEGASGKFLKPKTHPSLEMELNWFNSNEPDAIEFRKTHKLDKSGRFYRYKTINK